jgi:hypothetical protein
MNTHHYKYIIKSVYQQINYQFANQIKFSFILRDGTKKAVTADKGDHILAVAKKFDV